MGILEERTDYTSCFENGLTEFLLLYPIAAGEPSQQISQEQRLVDNGNRDHVYADISNRIGIMFDTP